MLNVRLRKKLFDEIQTNLEALIFLIITAPIFCSLVAYQGSLEDILPAVFLSGLLFVLCHAWGIQGNWLRAKLTRVGDRVDVLVEPFPSLVRQQGEVVNVDGCFIEIRTSNGESVIFEAERYRIL